MLSPLGQAEMRSELVMGPPSETPHQPFLSLVEHCWGWSASVSSRWAARGTYKVTDELGGICCERSRGQSHTKGEAALGLSSPVGNAPRVEGDAGAGISEGHRLIVLGKGRRQDYKLDISH